MDSLNEVTANDARKSVVIVGRPNVGKSTLFNRFLGEQAAIVEDRPGVTRDRHRREVEWCGHHFDVIDTGGWMPGGSMLDSKVSRQVEAAAREADLVLFLVDATVGLSDDDEAIADYIRLAIEDGDPGLLAAALGDVARARGMTQMAQATGLTREALYKALRPDAQPRFDTIQKVCRALGVKLTVTAA